MKRNQTYHQTFFMNVKKNVPWHILAPSAVACDKLHLRASAHHWHVSAFLCNRGFQGISYYTKKSRNDVHSHHSGTGYSRGTTRI